MGTTARGIAYPDDSSPIEDLQDHLQQLAETADAAVDDVVAGTGWTSLTSSVSGVTAAYRVIGGFVAVRLGGSVTSLATATNANVVTSGNALPSNLRPASNLWTGCYVSGGAWMGVNADGTVYIRHEGGSNRSGTVAAMHIYPIG